MDYLSFRLTDAFVEKYAATTPPWRTDAGGGNNLSEITFFSKYSRKKDDGTKERWHEVCRRTVEGMYSIMKDYCIENHTPWNDFKAQRSAQEAYDRMFAFKWTPPGRGLWTMGTYLVNGEKNAAPLYNCAFISTEKISAHSAQEATFPFVRMMDMSMHGIGVGFDTRGEGNIVIQQPIQETWTFVVPDTREGWCESLHHLLTSYFFKSRKTVEFDYSQVRPAGSPLRRFGGTASGPGPLKELHELIRGLLHGREGERITSMDILDIMNATGKAVVAGGARRSAQIALGSLDDEQFLNAKNIYAGEHSARRMGYLTDEDGKLIDDGNGWYERHPEGGWGNLSNNTVFYGTASMENLDRVVESIRVNGEPGIMNIDLARSFGRLADGFDDRDSKIMGVNPCAEIVLESSELCNLVEVYPIKHESVDDYLRTLKFAYLYSKTVTLLPTPWAETNEVIKRNRRIGTSLTGIVEFTETRGLSELVEWCELGYAEIQARDAQYSSWLGVRESIRNTTVKPSGTTSLIASTTAGVHWPIASGDYIKRNRLHKSDPLVIALKDAGYQVEPDVMDPDSTVVVTFPIKSNVRVRSEREVSVWEKASLAAKLQRYWADNAVSVTLSFTPEERSEILHVTKFFADQLKTMSFLPLQAEAKYAQMPFEDVDDSNAHEFEHFYNQIRPIDWNMLYNSGVANDAEGERYCANDTCEIQF